ncbi:MAG: hypothetical protein AABX88_00095 [Nanoarchaeota archaeon]
MVEYYQIKKKNKQDQNGIVVVIRDGKLETYAGEGEPHEFGCVLNGKGKMNVKSNFIPLEISDRHARRLKEDYMNWLTFQNWLY